MVVAEGEGAAVRRRTRDRVNTVGQKMPTIPKAVIFDFDGVILKSADIKTQAFLSLFADYPEYRDRILRYHLDNLGVSRYKKFEWIYSQLLRTPLENAERERLGAAFAEIVLGKVLACDYVEGAWACLEALSGRRDLFVASGTPQEELEFIITKRGLRHFFREIWGTPTTKVEIIKSILDRHGFQKDDVVFIGDGLSDYKAASDVGIPFIAVDNRTSDVDWKELGLKALVDLNDLLDMLDMNEIAIGARDDGTEK